MMSTAEKGGLVTRRDRPFFVLAGRLHCGSIHAGGDLMFLLIRRGLGGLAFLAVLVHGAPAAGPKPLAFHIHFDPKVSNAPFTGRVYVMLSREPVAEPRSGPNWFRPEPIFARDVKDWN